MRCTARAAVRGRASDLHPGLWALTVLASACLPSPSLPSHDAGQDISAPPAPPTPPAVIDLSVVDEDGVAHAQDETPLRPVLVLRLTGPMEGDPEPLMLLRGEVDGALIEDLASAPLRVATRARVLDACIERFASGAQIRPSAALEPGERYLLALAAWAGEDNPLGVPFGADLRAAEHGGGARVDGSWPADGTEGVPGVIPLLAVRFDEIVRGAPAGVRLVDESGSAVPTRRALTSCLALGWPEGDCTSLEPIDPLWPGRPHRIEVTEEVLDRGGAPVGPVVFQFRTGTGAFLSPSLNAPACALDETLWRGDVPEGVPPEESPALGCLFVDDRSLELRLTATGPLRYRLEGGAGSTRAVAARGDAALTLRHLAPDTAQDLWLDAVDLAGHTLRLPVHAQTTEALDAVYVMEVRADPLGAEPRQEYVEVLNAGTTTVDLGGYSLSDAGDRPGDVLPSPSPLGPSERALLVADGFDPTDGHGAPIPAGARLIRLGTSLGSGGLSNSGEPVYLRDALGRRLSGAPARPTAGAGICLVRVVEDGRRMDDDAFAFQGSCTPGTGRLAR